jgi:hypothetical protein
MNQHDKSNLEFIMSLNDKEFDVWLESIDDADADYAMQLIRDARSELLLQEMDLLEQTKSANFTHAKIILDRIMAKK